MPFFWCDLQTKGLHLFLCKRCAPLFEVKQRWEPFLPRFSEILPRYLDILPGFSGICQDFSRISPDFQQVKTFGGAPATPASPPPTPLSSRTFEGSEHFENDRNLIVVVYRRGNFLELRVLVYMLNVNVVVMLPTRGINLQNKPLFCNCFFFFRQLTGTRAGLIEREAPGKVVRARPSKRLAQLRSVSHALV